MTRVTWARFQMAIYYKIMPSCHGLAGSCLSSTCGLSPKLPAPFIRYSIHIAINRSRMRNNLGLQLTFIGFLVSLLQLLTIWTFQQEACGSSESRTKRTRQLAMDGDGLYGNDKKPLLTLFTTFSWSENKSKIHDNTFTNWNSLRPWILPVFYSTEDDVSSNYAAHMAGWRTRQVNQTSPGLPPRVRLMFQDAIAQYDTPFYGFANGDILFDMKLITTLSAVDHMRPLFEEHGLLLVGKRTNVDYREINVTSRADMRGFASKGELFGEDAQDYFITTRFGFPWKRIPDLVVGKPGYDNWLVKQAQVWNLTLLDATPTIIAVHQTDTDGNKAGWNATDRCVNRDMIGPYNYKPGHTDCAQWITATDLEGKIHVVTRENQTLPEYCNLDSDVIVQIDFVDGQPRYHRKADGAHFKAVDDQLGIKEDNGVTGGKIETKKPISKERLVEMKRKKMGDKGGKHRRINAETQEENLNIKPKKTTDKSVNEPKKKGWISPCKY